MEHASITMLYATRLGAGDSTRAAIACVPQVLADRRTRVRRGGKGWAARQAKRGARAESRLGP